MSNQPKPISECSDEEVISALEKSNFKINQFGKQVYFKDLSLKEKYQYLFWMRNPPPPPSLREIWEDYKTEMRQYGITGLDE